jgi:tetratricopeptide (TPR) repeat protein
VICVIVSVAVVFVLAYLWPPYKTARIEPWQMPDLPEPTIELPLEAVEVPNEELQAEAVREAETLLARFPQHAQVLHAAAMLYAGLHQTGRAEELWRRCIELDPGPSGPRVGLATALSERGKDAEAADILSKLLADGHSTDLIYHQLGTILTKLGKLDEAEAFAQQGVRAFPTCAANWLLLGQTQNQLRKFADAESSLRRAIELDDRSSTARFALANACMRQGKQDEARESRRKFAELEASAASERGNERFQEKYRRGLMPKVIRSLGLFGSFCFQQGDPDEGQRLLLRALSLDPGNELFLGELASNYLRLGRDADSYLVQQRLVQLDPKNASYLFNLGTTAKRIGDLPSAEMALTEVIALDPDLSEPYASLAQIHAQMGNFEQARSYAKTGVEKYPSVSGYGILALTCEALGDENGALAAHEMASKLAAGAALPQTGKQRTLGR